MKKIWVIGLLVLLLSGCGKEKPLETVADVPDAPVMAAMQKVLVELPPQLSTPALQDGETGTLYLCDDYSVTIQTVSAGDLEKTIRSATGMKKEDLQIIQTHQGDVKRYQWVWTANGEDGIQVGRCCVLDDGTYHYVLTAMAREDLAGKVSPEWRGIFASYRLTTDMEDINTGS